MKMMIPDVESQHPLLSAEQIDALLDNLKVVESMKGQIDRLTVELAMVRSRQSQTVNDYSGKENKTVSKIREGGSNVSRKTLCQEKVDDGESAFKNGKKEPDLEAFYDAVDEVPDNVDSVMAAVEESDADDTIIPARGRMRYSSLYHSGFAGIKYAKSSFMGRKSLPEEESGELEQDLFTTMMLYPPLVAFRSFTTSRRGDASTVRTYPCFRISKVWMLGILAFITEMTLGALVVMDQVIDIETMTLAGCQPWDGFLGHCKSQFFLNQGNLLSIPLKSNVLVQIAQGITIPLAFISQTDIVTSMRTVYQLRGNNWHEMIYVDQNSKTKWAWLVRILLPNVFKFTEALVILFASWVVIVQSESIVDLLKDFSALMVISSIDNVLFVMAENGFFGEDLLDATKQVKGVKVDNSAFKRRSGWIFKTIIFVILSSMMAGWGILVQRQNSGYFFKLTYPDCPAGMENVNFRDILKEGIPGFHFYNNGGCNNFLNNAECGYDGSDCDRDHYPGCNANFTRFIGDGTCDQSYNNSECNWDGGDC